MQNGYEIINNIITVAEAKYLCALTDMLVKPNNVENLDASYKNYIRCKTDVTITAELENIYKIK